jgi:hypothetical protein
MADEVRVSSPGPNGNGFSLDLREKKLGLTGPNIALMLLIIIIGYIAWDRTGKLDTTIGAIHNQITAGESRLTTQMATAETRLHERMESFFGRLNQLSADLQAQNLLLNANNAKVTEGQQILRTHLDEALTRQNDLVHSQTAAIEAKMAGLATAFQTLFADLKQYVETWFSEVGKRFEIHDWNTLNPEKSLPLRAPVAPPRDDRPGGQR